MKEFYKAFIRVHGRVYESANKIIYKSGNVLESVHESVYESVHDECS